MLLIRFVSSLNWLASYYCPFLLNDEIFYRMRQSCTVLIVAYSLTGRIDRFHRMSRNRREWPWNRQPVYRMDLQNFIVTHQMKHGVDNFPIRHLSHFDQPDQHGEFQAVVHRHRHHLLGPFNVTERWTFYVRHRDGYLSWQHVFLARKIYDSLHRNRLINESFSSSHDNTTQIDLPC